jgi:hypothetical protein
MMCDFNHEDECSHAAAAEREIIREQLQQLMTDNKQKLSQTAGVTRAIRLMGTIIGLEDAIKLIESLEE